VRSCRLRALTLSHWSHQVSCDPYNRANETNCRPGPRLAHAAACIHPADDILHGRQQKSWRSIDRLFSLLIPASVNIIDASSGSVISRLPAENVYELGFSPLGTYIITWQRPSKDEAGDAVKNLKVWRVVDNQATSENTEKQTIGKFVQKNQTGWNLQYTFDERFCARVVTNEVQIYESHDLTKVWNKLRVEGVLDFAVSPGENHSIAVFVPERKV
jgi:translation initiation factor 2A